MQRLGAIPVETRSRAALSLCCDAIRERPQLLLAHGLDPDDPVSFLLVEKDRTWRNTDALQQVLVGLGGAWRAARVLHLVPVQWRDPLYRTIARNRYRWFGRHDRCYLPTAGQQDRFLS